MANVLILIGGGVVLYFIALGIYHKFDKSNKVTTINNNTN